MQIAKVIGTAVATEKHDSLIGKTMLLCAPLMADGKSIDGDPLLVIDQLGAWRGETVIISSDGSGAAELMGRNDSPVRWTTCGIRDA